VGEFQELVRGEIYGRSVTVEVVPKETIVVPTE